MRIKFILTLLITLFTLQFASAQSTIDRVSPLDVIHLVTDANFKLNGIYRERVQGHEDEQAALRKAIYSANNELMSIRSILSGSNMIKDDKLAKIQKPFAELQMSIDSVEPTMSVSEIQKSIIDVRVKAKAMKKVLDKLKR